MPTAARCTPLVQTLNRALCRPQGILSYATGHCQPQRYRHHHHQANRSRGSSSSSRDNTTVVVVEDPRVSPTSRYYYSSSSAASSSSTKPKTFHSSKKTGAGGHSDSRSRPSRQRSKYRTLYILVGLTVATSIASVLYERKDIKPREFLE